MAAKEIRKWYIDQALHSVSRLNGCLFELTEEEVLKCLELESAAARRASIIDRLISRAVRLNELKYSQSLKELYHGNTSNIHNPVQD